MKKAVLFLSLLGMCNLSFGQIRKIELTRDEIDFIAVPKRGIFGIDEKAVIYNVNQNKNIYSFEIEYNGKVLYRGTVNKWNSVEHSISEELGRTRVGVCFKYADLPSDVILELLENRSWKSDTVNNEKMVCNGEYKVFKQDLSSDDRKYIPNHIIKGKIKTKLYRLEEE